MINKLYQCLKIYGPKKFVEIAIGEALMLKRVFLEGSFSQNREDVVIDNLLGNKSLGFYVDVGGYDPTRMSNTKRFYLRGWTGINIEPNPKNIKKFYKSRPKDINLNLGIANKKGKLTYYNFETETLSTFSKEAANEYQKEGFRLAGTLKINVSKLSDTLAKYCKGKNIDFLSVDAEGYDYEVLRSNDWKKFRPTLVCIESNPLIDRLTKRLMLNAGYIMAGKNHNNLIYLRR